jgi:hypothetical protein
LIFDPGGDCGGWTDANASNAVYGFSSSTFLWSTECIGGCAAMARVYCFEQ